MCVYRETELFRFENEVISDKVLQFIGLLAKTAFTTKVMMDCNIGECELDECLVHAAECHRDHHACESKLCGLLKSKIAHHRDCPVDQYCAECLEIIDLCMRHALECGKGPGECKYVEAISLKFPDLLRKTFTLFALAYPGLRFHRVNMCASSLWSAS